MTASQRETKQPRAGRWLDKVGFGSRRLGMGMGNRWLGEGQILDSASALELLPSALARGTRRWRPTASRMKTNRARRGRERAAAHHRQDARPRHRQVAGHALDETFALHSTGRRETSTTRTARDCGKAAPTSKLGSSTFRSVENATGGGAT